MTDVFNMDEPGGSLEFQSFITRAKDRWPECGKWFWDRIFDSLHRSMPELERGDKVAFSASIGGMMVEFDALDSAIDLIFDDGRSPQSVFHATEHLFRLAFWTAIFSITAGVEHEIEFSGDLKSSFGSCLRSAVVSEYLLDVIGLFDAKELEKAHVKLIETAFRESFCTLAITDLDVEDWKDVMNLHFERHHHHLEHAPVKAKRPIHEVL